MSKYIQTIPLSRIKRIAILTGNGRTLSQVKGDADLILNGGFYHMSSGSPTGHLKIDGTVLSKESWSCWGFRWDSGPDIRMDVVPASGGANYISGVELLTRDLKKNSKLNYSSDVGGKRGRSALATGGDHLILYCSGDGTADAATPEALRDELVSLGADRAIMLDGGGSSQCDLLGKTIVSSRRVHNYLAVWLTEETPLPGRYVVTPASGLRIRKGPGTSYARLGLYPCGTSVTLFEISNDWGRTDQGWVSMEYLTALPADSSVQEEDSWELAVSRGLFPHGDPDAPMTCGQTAALLQKLNLI